MSECERCVCLQVFEDVQADPVVIRVGDDTQAHVGSGVVQVAQQVHRSAASLRTQQGVQLPTPEQLVGSIAAHWSTGRVRKRQRERERDVMSSTCSTSEVRLSSVSSPEVGVGEAAVQVSLDVPAALLSGQRVPQDQQHLLLLLLCSPCPPAHLSHQVDPRQLVAVSPTAHCHPRQPGQTHQLTCIHLTTGGSREFSRAVRVNITNTPK